MHPISIIRFSLIAVFASALTLAQSGSDAAAGTAPPEVDQALRARLQEFNDLQLKGQFRKAESYVAEDTKDYYYNVGKPRYKSLEVISIEYFENFTRARVKIACERYIVAPGFPPDVPMKGRFESLWKIENGVWCYYEDPNTFHQSPLGNMGVVRTLPPGAPAAGPGLPGPIPAIPTSPSFALNMVKADKESVALKAGGSAEVSFLNNAPGQMTLAIDEKPAGVEAMLDRKQIPAGETAVLKLKAAKGKVLKPGTVKVRVVQTTEVIPVQVSLK